MQNSNSSSLTSTKNRFTQEEDEKLKSLVQQWGKKNWKVVASKFENRTPRKCRDRLNQHLDSDFNQDEWTAEEDERIIEGFQQLGVMAFNCQIITKTKCYFSSKKVFLFNSNNHEAT
jgi:hypothetical protein